jgi:hypothetical protein
MVMWNLKVTNMIVFIILMRDNGDVESESDKYDCKDMLPLKDCTKMNWHYILRSH